MPCSHPTSVTSSSASTPVDTGEKEEGEEEEGEVEEEAGWYWPVMTGEHVPHLVGFAKSLLWECARAEVGPSGTREAYRGAGGVNEVY